MGSFAVEDHLRCGDRLRLGIICGTVQWVACVFQGDWTNKVEDIIVADGTTESKRF